MDQKEITLKDIIAWRDEATMFIAYRHVVSPESRQAMEAVSQLANIARQLLPKPGEPALKWSLQNDPYCRTAYDYGYQKGYEKANDDRSHWHIGKSSDFDSGVGGAGR